MKAEQVFDFRAGNVETVEVASGEVEIKYRRPNGAAINAVNLSAADENKESMTSAMIHLVAESLVEWPWDDVEISEENVDAMFLKNQELFYEIFNVLVEAEAEAKN